LAFLSHIVTASRTDAPETSHGNDCARNLFALDMVAHPRPRVESVAALQGEPLAATPLSVRVDDFISGVVPDERGLRLSGAAEPGLPSLMQSVMR
jgi:hypothetical protein